MSKRGELDSASTKRNRLERIQKMLEGGEEVALSRVIATIEYQMGLTPKKARSYLNILVQLNFIEIDDLKDIVYEVKQA